MPQNLFLGLLLLLLSISGAYYFIKSLKCKFIGFTLIFSAFVILFYTYCDVLSFSRIPTVRFVISIVLTIGLLYFSVIEYFIYSDSKSTSDKSLDFIIVHGAKVYGSRPSPSLLDRLEATLLYLQTHQHTVAILTGAKWPFSDISEAQCMYEWLTARGIAPERLIIEDQASDTLENLRYSINVIKSIYPHDFPSIGLVTSDYHMHRALYLARAESMDSAAIAVPTTRLSVRVNYFIREAFAMTEIYLFGVEGL